ncbi:catalase [Longimycelium tulufanense]|uniref:Catalase n=1 Tax=Longimycelium tulufanense TaxID=907463 RepID=A0A8J3FYG0_9PSEU|nr:catalase [Longimycelium tulufanense]GGM71770.1 catalase [Longimycelium tulufanense]
MAAQPGPPDDTSPGTDDKQRQLDAVRVDLTGSELTTDQGVRVDHTDDALKAGERGPTLLEDFHAREKLTRFDHERIPERVVHARGAGAYGYFQPYDDRLVPYTVAEFLADPSVRTPVFVRFSTVAGSRGSADTVRDVRGFATKFYTQQGNYDLVGNNIPVFFIQDGIKFPDLVHALKPEPHNEIPQAQAAHDTFWDFVGQQPETLHMVMWLISDRALPRSYRMMQGFGVHTFRLVNAEGKGTFVKFHWTPVLGTHSLVWDEAQKIAGKDPDYNRRDLWDAIERGHHPEYELGVQLVAEEDEFAFDFDLLDATKIIPEEVVPVQPVGRLTLNRNPDNFFAETEQVAFHTANLVPGIDFTNDPLLQFRNFSYLDTQLIRLGGPNFPQIPVNSPVVPVTNNQRDGYHQHLIHKGRTSYSENALSDGYPEIAGPGPDVFSHYQEKVEGHKIRRRSNSFLDFTSQATLFWNSMSEPERKHIVAAFQFELGRVTDRSVRATVVDRLNHVDHELAVLVARGIGGPEPPAAVVDNHGRSSPALSQLSTAMESAATRQVAVLVADGVDGAGVSRLVAWLREHQVVPELLAPSDGTVHTVEGDDLTVDRAITTMASVLYDGVVVPCGPDSVRALADNGYAMHFIAEAYKHHKPVAAFGTGVDLLDQPWVSASLARDGAGVVVDQGVVTTPVAGEDLATEFAEALRAELARHRAWERPTDAVPA